jgi:tRNA-specific 2-thiouridylase
MSEQKRIFVGLSGGVDSSVAALRLKQAGHEVTGVFIKVWHPDWLVCNWEQERVDAMRIAATLDIPFLTCDAEAAYRDHVAKDFIASYEAGRTPNPDVLCNQVVKFGAFLAFAKEHGADAIATGHYAQRISDEHGPELHRSRDTGKDQTYFLWSLTKEQLQDACFPVGDSEKNAIRAEAEEAGLPTASKQDSQGICFLGHIDIPAFLSHYVELLPGDVLDERGTVVGQHRGALVYTLGQRHGFTISTNETERSQHYVIARNIEANTITVSSTPPYVRKGNEVQLVSTVVRTSVEPGMLLEAQFRYRQTPFLVTVAAVDENHLTLTLEDSVEQPAAGQSCVLYRGSHCIGGGIIQ